ncbi:MAG: phospholipase D family protein [Paracoccaceae bacterium]|nr:phospholipase D family protein [Paracoccaceae bacterium]
MRKRQSVIGIALLTLSLGLGACTPIPKDYARTPSKAITKTESTFLAQKARDLGDPRDGRSGFYLLSDGPEALGARIGLSRRAERSIDAQYYLVHDDVAGHLFASELLKAADRGVRVRLLIDDMDTSGYDAMTASLNDHPNVQIRLFNPFWRERGKALNAVLDFNRINHRMHNKSMTFDNAVTIVGGRNIGAEYFAANERSNYDDLDVLGVGPVATDVSNDFDAYWNSPYAVPAEVVVRSRDTELTPDYARVVLADLAEKASKTEYGAALDHEFNQSLRRSTLKLNWAAYRLMSDPPEKISGDTQGLPIIRDMMRPYMQGAEKSIYVASAYFVPRTQGETALADLEARGVDVTILTNSVDSNDVLPVYGHYARSRRPLLASGVELWELRSDRTRSDRERLKLGLSQSGLHTKAFIIDRRYVFVGSVNWDPRSININTEMGVLIEAPALAQRVVDAFEKNLPLAAYELSLDEKGTINWLGTEENGQRVLYLSEPVSSAWRMFMARLFGVLPIGKQL